MTPALHAIARLMALRMFDSLAEGTVIAIVAALVLAVTRKRNADTRFAVWFASLMAIATIPLIGSVQWSRGAASGVGAARSAITLPDQCAVYLFIAWGAFAAWFLVAVFRSLWHIRVLRKSCVAVDSAKLDPLVQDTLRRHSTKRRVALSTSELVRVPTAIGLIKPAIVIPRWVMQELSAAELNQVLLHEFAHLRRWDDWTNLAQQVMKAIFFFHPAVWWIEKKVALEREMACDDAVLAETESPRAYAECLTHLAERSFVQRSIALAQAALGKIRHTSLRLAQILAANRPTAAARSWKPAVSVVAACTIACAVWSSRAPRLIAFEDTVPTRTAVATPTFNREAAPLINSNGSKPLLTARVSPAKLKTRTAQSKPVLSARVTATPPLSKSKVSETIRLTSAQAGVIPITETVFVVIEGSDPAAQNLRLYEIQMFQLTILRQFAAPASKQTPRKEI